jgi:5-formyltetrahydrofolate cyclo-ligase
VSFNIDKIREEIRRKVWTLLRERGIARPPFPIEGRIPNFVGSEKAASRLASLEEWRRAQTLKVNPDSPQRPVRLLALRQGKILIMPTPRIRKGFLLLDPRSVPEGKEREASTIRGAFRYGTLLPNLKSIEFMIGHVDLIVEGSVAVDRQCNRLGKGEGYGDLEYAILYHLGKVDESTPIATTISDYQLVPSIPPKPNDLPLDIVVTPTRVLRCDNRSRRPRGLLPELLGRRKVEEIPILRELLNRISGGPL